jgi:hypothetical protein
MDDTMLTLRPDVELVEQGGRTGLKLNGEIGFARDEMHAALLRAIAEQGRSTDWLMAFLADRGASGPGGSGAALVLAAFILDFGEYLEP